MDEMDKGIQYTQIVARPNDKINGLSASSGQLFNDSVTTGWNELIDACEANKIAFEWESVTVTS